MVINDPENPLQEPFTLEIACELIGGTEQEEGIQVIKQDREWEWVSGGSEG